MFYSKHLWRLFWAHWGFFSLFIWLKFTEQTAETPKKSDASHFFLLPIELRQHLHRRVNGTGHTSPCCKSSSDTPFHGLVCFHQQVKLIHLNVSCCTCWVVSTGSAGVFWEIGNHNTGKHPGKSYWKSFFMLVAQLEDPEQRVGTVSPCPTACPNLAILVLYRYNCLPAWRCMCFTASSHHGLDEFRAKTQRRCLPRKEIQEGRTKRGLFFNMFSWQSPRGNSAGQRCPCGLLPSCRLWDERAGLSCLCVQRAPARTAVTARGTGSPLPARQRPPGCCCPWQHLRIPTGMQREAGLAPAPEVLLD